MAFNSAGHGLAMHQTRQGRRCRRTAITARPIAAGLSARGRRYAGKPDDAIPKPDRFAIKNANLRGLRRDGPIRGGRTEKIGRQTETKHQSRHQRATHTQPGTAEAGAEMPSFEDTPWFTHTLGLTYLYAMLQPSQMRKFRVALKQNAKSAT